MEDKTIGLSNSEMAIMENLWEQFPKTANTADQGDGDRDRVGKSTRRRC